MTPTQFRSALEKLGLPREEVAEWLGCNERSIRRWGNGSVPIPKPVELVLRYALKYGRTMDHT